jgi:hypothetical protein
MELTNAQHDFILTAIEAHIRALRKDVATIGEPLVTEVIQSRIDDMQPVLDALESGDWFFELVEY